MNKRRLIILIISVIFIAVCSFFAFNDHASTSKVLNTEEEIYDLITDYAAKNKARIEFTSSIDPYFINFDTLQATLKDKNIYACGEIYAFKYDFQETGKGTYRVHVKLSDPTKLHTRLAKMRVKAIAKTIKKYDDYDKVKMVHDYIILNDTYDYLFGGSFNCLYLGRSTCTGYAYGFYEIMNEAGVPVTLEYSENHVWNKVQVDGRWYNMDLCWDDAGGESVRYDYFLKADKDWKEHEHGGADALTSMEVKGDDAQTNYRKFPPYNIIMAVKAILILVGLLIIGYIIGRIKDKIIKDKQKKEEEFEAEQERIRRKTMITDGEFVMNEEMTLDDYLRTDEWPQKKKDDDDDGGDKPKFKLKM